MIDVLVKISAWIMFIIIIAKVFIIPFMIEDGNSYYITGRSYVLELIFVVAPTILIVGRVFDWW